MYATIDISRLQAPGQRPEKNRQDLGQVFTPYEVARYMASLFQIKESEQLAVLDPGAGIGSLSVAFLEQVVEQSTARLEILAYEIDENISPVLGSNLEKFAALALNNKIEPKIIQADFIKQGILDYLAGKYTPVDFAILNPPYKKINANSIHRQLLRKVGIETVNLYSAFVALSILMLKEGGQLVAIIPRSFCNGPYFKPFREFLLEKTVIRQIHIFTSRNKNFKEDNVLQENVIFHIQKQPGQENVKITSSEGPDFSHCKTFWVPFERIVFPSDTEKFIHIPDTPENKFSHVLNTFVFSLSDLGIEISTGPVVDFRIKDFLSKELDENSVPLVYPAHFGDKFIDWPKLNFKKYNAIEISEKTQKLLFPKGFYTVVRRFSSKEEKKRIVARVFNPLKINSEYIGFENHLNVFHQKKKGLPEVLALGLAVYLNSTLIDQYFRQFNGHTQVNATDLRLIKYPSKNTLIELGNWAQIHAAFDQLAIDAKISTLL